MSDYQICGDIFADMTQLSCFLSPTCKLNFKCPGVNNWPQSAESAFRKDTGIQRAGVWWISMARGTAWGEERGKPAPEGFSSVMELNSICKSFSADRTEPDVALMLNGARRLKKLLNIQFNQWSTVTCIGLECSGVQWVNSDQNHFI